jgi:signal transduction histidine kinase
MMRQVSVNREQLADCYISIAKAYLLHEEVGPSRMPLDSAGWFLAQLPGSSFQPGRYLVEGMYHARTGEWKNAIDSIDRGLTLARSMNRSYDESSLLFEKYDVYRRQKKFPEALGILREVYVFNERLPLVHNRRLILSELAQTEAALGHMDPAYKWMHEYATLSDSVSKAGTAVQIADLEAKYRSSEKERQLLELSNRAKIQRLLLWGGIILLTVGLLFFIYRSRQRKLQAEQAVRSLQQQQQIEVAGALMNGEERERQRLARELHDGLGGMLAGIKINLSEVVSAGTQDEMALQKVIKQLDGSVRELRHIAHNLMPESLLRSGLEVALNDLCESLGNGQTRVELQTMNIARDIPKQTQLIVYRIVQELLANVLKHAKASEVFVQCSQSENNFYITVEDDGVGMEQDKTGSAKGIGLENIRRRVEFLQGKLEIESSPGSGTVVNIEIHVV